MNSLSSTTIKTTEDTLKVAPIKKLPQELKGVVSEFLGFQDKASLSLVSKEWSEVNAVERRLIHLQLNFAKMQHLIELQAGFRRAIDALISTMPRS